MYQKILDALQRKLEARSQVRPMFTCFYRRVCYRNNIVNKSRSSIFETRNVWYCNISIPISVSFFLKNDVWRASLCSDFRPIGMF